MTTATAAARMTVAARTATAAARTATAAAAVAEAVVVAVVAAEAAATDVLEDRDRHHQAESELGGCNHQRLVVEAVGFQTTGHVDAENHRCHPHHDYLRHDADEAENRGGSEPLSQFAPRP